MRWFTKKQPDRGLWCMVGVITLALIDVQAVGQCELEKLLPSDGTAFEHFGRSVSISGIPGNEVAIVGASGSAYIYRFNGEKWIEEQKLLDSNGARNDLFGSSVSISGPPGNEVAIVGALLDDDNGLDSGSAFIFRFNPDTSVWVEEQKLLASDGVARDLFGQSVSISGTPGNEIAIVGANRDDDNGTDSGSAYIYRFNPDTSEWVEEQKLLASDGAERDFFGNSVSISGTPGNEVAIVGAVYDDDNGLISGSAYIYRFNGVTWVEEAKLLASDGAANDKFGLSVSISGTPGNEIAIVGAYLDDDKGPNSGSAYIYRFNGVTWVEEQKLLASDGAASDLFGGSVSISGTPGNEVAIIGAIGDDDSGSVSGSVYIYRFNGVNWVEEAKLIASDGAWNDRFGISVSISGAPGNEVAIVGAHFHADNGMESGSAYVFGTPIIVCPGDIVGGDDVVDVMDLIVVLSSWGTCTGSCSDCPQDTNTDGEVNVFDLLDILINWGPCP